MRKANAPSIICSTAVYTAPKPDVRTKTPRSWARARVQRCTGWMHPQLCCWVCACVPKFEAFVAVCLIGNRRRGRGGGIQHIQRALPPGPTLQPIEAVHETFDVHGNAYRHRIHGHCCVEQQRPRHGLHFGQSD